MSSGLLIFANADPLTGSRSVVRQLQLAREWSRRAGQVRMAGQALPGRLVWQIRHAGIEYVNLTPPDSPSDLARQLWSLSDRVRFDSLVIDDGDGELTRHILETRPAGRQLILLGSRHDTDGKKLDVDFATDHRASFALIAEPTVSKPRSDSRPRKSGPDCRKMLVDLSGTHFDSGQRIARLVIDQIAAAAQPGRLGLELVWPLARCGAHELVAGDNPESWLSVHRNPDRSTAATSSVDFALWTTPNEFYEAVACGIPGLLLVSGAAEMPDLRQMSDLLNTPVVIDCRAQRWRQKLSRAIEKFTDCPDQLPEQGRQLGRLVDHQGVQRLCDAIAGLSGRTLRRQTA